MKRVNTTRHVFIYVIFILGGCSFFNDEPKPQKRDPIPPVEVQVPAETEVVQKEEPVAKLAEFKADVSFRRKESLEWNPVEIALTFFRFDAVRTMELSDAKVTFTNGSELYIGPDSVVVLNPRDFKNEKPRDRALVKKGRVRGQTQRELWLMTSGGLLKIRPKSQKNMARAELSVEENKKVKVRVEEGEALLLPPPQLTNILAVEAAPVLITERKELVLDVASAISETWPEENRAEEVFAKTPVPEERKIASVPPLKIDTVKISELFPRDYSEIDGATIALTGKLKGEGGRVVVNGVDVTLDKKNKFKRKISLNLGVNSIQIELIQPNGQSSFQRLTLIRKR